MVGNKAIRKKIRFKTKLREFKCSDCGGIIRTGEMVSGIIWENPHGRNEVQGLYCRDCAEWG